MSFTTVDPTTGRPLKTYEHLSFDDADRVVQAAWRDFESWRDVHLQERAQALVRWANRLRDIKDDLALLMTQEMGKPLRQSLAEIEKSIETLGYLAVHGPSWLAAKPVFPMSGEGEIAYEPTGVLFAIMPWNFPLWQVVRAVGPAVLAGNTALLKHSDLTAGSAELIVMSAADIAEDVTVLRSLPVDHEVAARVIAHPRVRGVTFTGSTRGGREIARAAAESLKKTVLELGGSDAYLILADAAAASAAQICAAARMVNNGQSCVAAKRFIVERALADVFIPEFVARMRAYEPGDPAEPGTTLGPLAAKKFQAQLAAQVEDLKKRGAKVLLGAEVPSGPSAFYPSTVLLFEKPQPGLGDVELFGPVAMVIVVENADEAIRVANDSPYGLGGAVFTSDVERGRRIAAKLEAGFVAINDSVRSDVRLPFGGVKESGYGRELSPHGVLEFCNIQARTWSTKL